MGKFDKNFSSKTSAPDVFHMWHFVAVQTSQKLILLTQSSSTKCRHCCWEKTVVLKTTLRISLLCRTLSSPAFVLREKHPLSRCRSWRGRPDFTQWGPCMRVYTFHFPEVTKWKYFLSGNIALHLAFIYYRPHAAGTSKEEENPGPQGRSRLGDLPRSGLRVAVFLYAFSPGKKDLRVRRNRKSVNS